MKPETTEWIDKAEGDWMVAQRETKAADPVWNVLCFLAQQCAEKYLKAFLEEQNVAFQKTHDLVNLLDLSSGQIPDLDLIKSRLAQLGTLGIAARYPGVHADRPAAEAAMTTAAEVRIAVRRRLGTAG